MRGDTAMNVGKALAIACMVLDVVACIGYAFDGDVRRAVYWGAAAVITASVTF